MCTIVFNELRILLWIQYHLRNDFLDIIMKFFTTIGNVGTIWIIIALYLMLRKDTREGGIKVFLGLLFSFIICNLIFKNVLMKERPFEVYKYVDLIIKKPNGYSFPSGHTSASIAAAYIIFKEKYNLLDFLKIFRLKGNNQNLKIGLDSKKMYINLGYIMYFMAFMIAFSRMYLFVHYPSDILGGILTGIISADVAIFVFDRLIKKYI